MLWRHMPFRSLLSKGTFDVRFTFQTPLNHRSLLSHHLTLFANNMSHYQQQYRTFETTRVLSQTLLYSLSKPWALQSTMIDEWKSIPIFLCLSTSVEVESPAIMIDWKQYHKVKAMWQLHPRTDYFHLSASHTPWICELSLETQNQLKQIVFTAAIPWLTTKLRKFIYWTRFRCKTRDDVVIYLDCLLLFGCLFSTHTYFMVSSLHLLDLNCCLSTTNIYIATITQDDHSTFWEGFVSTSYWGAIA